MERKAELRIEQNREVKKERSKLNSENNDGESRQEPSSALYIISVNGFTHVGKL